MEQIKDFLRMCQLHSHRKELDRVGVLLDDPDVTRLVQIIDERRTNGIEAAVVLLDYYDGESRPDALDIESTPLSQTDLARIAGNRAGGGCGTRLVNLLEDNGLLTVGDLLATSMETIGGFRNMGPAQLRIIEQVRNVYQSEKHSQVKQIVLRSASGRCEKR